MATPRISSSLRESAAPAASTTAPKAGNVLVVGTAGAGPTTPIKIERVADADRIFGIEGTLARDVREALLGAQIGASVAGTRVYGQVTALRLATGKPATVTLKAADASDVFTIETVESSLRANSWKVYQDSEGYAFYDPAADETTRFRVDKTGSGVSSIGSASPSQLAQRIRSRYDGKLLVDVSLDQARYEISLSSKVQSATASPIASSTADRTEIDLTAVDVSALQTLATAAGAFTWIGFEEGEFHKGSPAAVHNRLLAADNDEARIYAITAGAPVVAAAQQRSVRVPKLADAKRIGLGLTNTLLNITTTGEDSATAVTLQSAGERSAVRVSEGYFRVRQAVAGAFDPTATVTADPYETLVDSVWYTTTITAAHGIAGVTAGDSDDRLGEHFSYTPDVLSTVVDSTLQIFKLEARSVFSDTPSALALSFDPTAGDPASHAGFSSVRYVRSALVDNEDGTYDLLMNKADYDALYGRALDDAALYASYDTEIVALAEKADTQTLDDGAVGYEYAAAGDIVTFNKALPHDLVIRGLRVSQYRLGRDATITRTADGGNAITILGVDNQPGEAGGAIGPMQVVFGVDFQIEPDWPELTAGEKVSGKSFTGATSGANVSAADKVAALADALAEYRDVDFFVLVPSGMYIDDTDTVPDPQTGLPIRSSTGLADAVGAHLDRLDANGASGIAYLSARPMQPATSSGRYTDAQKSRRFAEFTVVDASETWRAANVITAMPTRPTMFIFDAPFETSLGGQRYVSDGNAFRAGLRSAMTNLHALYTIDMPDGVEPLYKYDLVDQYLPGQLASLARINTWDETRGLKRLASERSAAAGQFDRNGNPVSSNYESGVAVLVAQQFRRAARAQLQALIGPLESGGRETLVASAYTIVRSVAANTPGVEDLLMDPEKHIQISALGGAAFAMTIEAQLLVAGELQRIELSVGTTTAA